MKLNAYVVFDGTCREAFETWSRILDAPITMTSTFGDMPGGTVDASHRDRIMHVRMERDDWVLMGSDSGPGMAYQGLHGCSLSIQADSREQAERVFAALAEGGKVDMPLDRTFWAERFGMVQDRFGMPWMVNFHGDAETGTG